MSRKWHCKLDGEDIEYIGDLLVPIMKSLKEKYWIEGKKVRPRPSEIILPIISGLNITPPPTRLSPSPQGKGGATGWYLAEYWINHVFDNYSKLTSWNRVLWARWFELLFLFLAGEKLRFLKIISLEARGKDRRIKKEIENLKSSDKNWSQAIISNYDAAAITYQITLRVFDTPPHSEDSLVTKVIPRYRRG